MTIDGIATYFSEKPKTHLVTALLNEPQESSGQPCCTLPTPRPGSEDAHTQIRKKDGRPAKRDPTPRFASYNKKSVRRAVSTLPTHTIAIGNDDDRNNFYHKCFQDMLQSGCKVMGKAWVKLLEPRKQSTYPYTKGEEKRPPWWPATTGPNQIRHKEPDHLHKRERIILLIHILSLIVSQDPNSPARKNKIDVAKLKRVTNRAMASWFADKEKPNNAKKRGHLVQLFCVLHNEERYRRGELDASAIVSISPGGDNRNSGPSPCQSQSASHIPPSPPSTLSPSATTTTASDNFYSSLHLSYTRNTTLDKHTSTNPYIISNHGRQQPSQQPTYTPQPPIYHSQQHVSPNTLSSYPYRTQQFVYGLPTISSPFSPERQSVALMQPPMALEETDTFDRKVMRGYTDGGWGWGWEFEVT
ncbi:hypothetical protein ACLOAV_004581 [Pseudogymnoascus australis]